jgi:hypothetical protein
MNKYTIGFLFVNALFIFVTVGGSICPQGTTFPFWMTGRFFAQFPDGSLANESFALLYANITFSNGTTGIITMTQPLNKSSSFFIYYECFQIQGREPQQRCGLLVPNCNGYTEYVHKAPELVSVCPESTTSPDLETTLVQRNGKIDISMFF